MGVGIAAKVMIDYYQRIRNCLLGKIKSYFCFTFMLDTLYKFKNKNLNFRRVIKFLIYCTKCHLARSLI